MTTNPKPELHWGEVTSNDYIICPNCGYGIEAGDQSCLQSDGDESTWDCDECGCRFIASLTVVCTYKTTEIIGEQLCWACSGTGMSASPLIPKVKCHQCSGTGKVPKTASDEYWEARK